MKRFLLTLLVCGTIAFGAFQLLVHTSTPLEAADKNCNIGATCHNSGQPCGKDNKCECEWFIFVGLSCTDPDAAEM